MTKDKIVQYIKKGLEKGFSLEHVMEMLEQKGYHKQDVQMAANLFQQPKEEKKREIQIKEKKNNRFLVIIVVLFLVSGLLYLSIYTINKQRDTEQQLTAQQAALETVFRQQLANEARAAAQLLDTLQAEEEKNSMILGQIEGLNATALNITHEEYVALVEEHVEGLQERMQARQKIEQDLQETFAIMER